MNEGRSHHPTLRSGKLTAGNDCHFGENVVIDVAEEVVIGDRCVIPDNSYLCGRRIEIGSDFYGYSHWGKRLEIGLGRRDDEHAILKVGSRCTFHDNRIDLARGVTVGDDVGLSPEVAIYTHYYWGDPRLGYPQKHAEVRIKEGCLIGFRATILPGVVIERNIVVGAGAVVANDLTLPKSSYGGNPAKLLRQHRRMNPEVIEFSMELLQKEYDASRKYRGMSQMLSLANVIAAQNQENEDTDDAREFLFKHGIRIFTNRPFRKQAKR